MVDLISDGSAQYPQTASDAQRPHQSFAPLVRHRSCKRLYGIPRAFEDCDPAQSGLGTLQYKKLKQRPVIGHQSSPLLIVVLHIQFIRSAPAATSVYYILHTYNIYTSAKIAKFRFTPIYKAFLWPTACPERQRAPHPAIPAHRHNGRRNDLSTASSLPHRGLSVRLAKRWYGTFLWHAGRHLRQKWPHGKQIHSFICSVMEGR